MSNNNNNNSARAEGKPPKLVGAISELGDAVFTIGEKNSLTNFETIKRKMALHVGSEISSDMYNLIQFGKEKKIKEPAKPATKAVTRSDTDTTTTTTGTTVDPYEMKMYDKKIDAYIREEKEYSKDKGRCFVMILGQCSRELIDKIEGDDKAYADLLDDNDVVGLLKLMKELIASPAAKEYLIETMVQAVLKLFAVGQNQPESFPFYRSRLMTLSDAMFTYVDIVPVQLPTGVSKEQFKEALLSYLLLRGGHKDNYGALKAKLRDNHGTKAGEYPTTMDEMISMMNDNFKKNNKPRNDNRDSTPRTSNLQANQVDSSSTNQQTSSTPVAPPRRSRAGTPNPVSSRSTGLFQL